MTRLKIWLEACLSPIGLLTILLIAGLVLVTLRRASRLGWRLLLVGAGLCLVLLLTPVAEVVYASLEHPYPPVTEADPGVRKVVVLVGHAEDTPGLPVTSRLSAEAVLRATEGIRLYRQITGGKLLLSGGIMPRQNRPSAAYTAEFAMAVGVPSRDIVLEAQSTTTYENFVELKKLLGTEPFMLVTSSDHIRRAMAVARHLGMQPHPAPATIWASRYFPAGMSWLELGWRFVRHSGYPRPHRLTYLQRASREYVGYLWYWMRGRV